MNWHQITTNDTIEDIKSLPIEKFALIFKHSTRCSISDSALNRLERNWDASIANCELYFLDLLKFKPLSQLIAQTFEIEHESPQVILVKNGEAIYHASHLEINFLSIKKYLT